MKVNELIPRSKPSSQRSSAQTLDRGLEILKILGERDHLSASQIAEKLGIHQSNVSRMLSSLVKAGFVKKPSFHQFSLDYGILDFAGIALNKLAGSRAARKVCSILSEKSGNNVSVGMLREESLFYLSQMDLDKSAEISFASETSQIFHKSSLGSVMAWGQGKELGVKMLKKSLELCREKNAAEEVWETIDNSLSRYGVYSLEGQPEVEFNIATPMTLDGEPAALAMFSRNRKASFEEITDLLLEGMIIMSKDCDVDSLLLRMSLQTTG